MAEQREAAVTQQDVDRASDAETTWAMARTAPTTVVGAAAVLDNITFDPDNGLFELSRTHWHQTAFLTLSAALAKISSVPIAPAAE